MFIDLCNISSGKIRLHCTNILTGALWRKSFGPSLSAFLSRPVPHDIMQSRPHLSSSFTASFIFPESLQWYQGLRDVWHALDISLIRTMPTRTNWETTMAVRSVEGVFERQLQDSDCKANGNDQHKQKTYCYELQTSGRLGTPGRGLNCLSPNSKLEYEPI